MQRFLVKRRLASRDAGGLRLGLLAAAMLILFPAAVFSGAVGVKAQFDREHDLRGKLQATYEYRSGMRSVLIDLQDAETGQRGFLLTGRASYLAPFRRARAAVAGDLRQLATPSAVVDPTAVDRLALISREKFRELDETVGLRAAGRLDAALAVVRSDRGQHAMDAARAIVALERLRTGRLLATWSRLADRSAQTTQATALGVGLLMLLALVSSAGLIWQVLRQRRIVIADLGQANAENSGLLRTAALAEHVSDSGHWTLCVSSGQQTWSPGIFQIFGLEGDTPPPVEEVIGYYVERDRVRVQEQVDRALRECAGFEFEHGIVDAQGRSKQLRLKAEFLDDATGGCLIGVVRDVTAERRAQLELAESETRYRHLADSSTDMMATMAVDSTILFISPACRRILGYLPEELIGRRTLSLTHPDDLPGVLAVFEGLRRAGPGETTYAYRFRGRHKDGAWVWLEGQPRVEFDAHGAAVRYQDVVREIGSRKAAEEALERSRARAVASERRYRLLAENATDMIARYGVDGVIRYVSPACRKVIGYSPEELVGCSTLSLIEPEDLGRIRDQFAASAAAPSPEPMHTEHRVRCKDGRTIWLEGRPKLVFDDAGRPVEYQDVMRDVTARKAMECELREARAAAEAAARSKADFLANMSHELRTPLNSIVGFAGLIADAAELSDETRHRVRIVRDSSRALVEIVNDILDFSKFEAEGVALIAEPTDIANLLTGTVELLQQQAEAKNIRLELGFVADVGVVLVDAARVRQVVLNLLGNAVKFTEKGEVSLSLTETAKGALRIEVRDTGVGIPADRLDRIFERFAQADGSTSRRFGGTGLGLTICRLIVDELGGDLEVQSALGVGSTFSFTFDPPKVRPAIPSADPAPSAVSSLAGLRVLVADDNPFNQELFVALMEGYGLEITLVADGREAVAAVEATPFDIVLMDMQMPVMDGLEATRTIRDLGETVLPIVALTANVVPSQIALCLESGMNDHLAKPYTAEAALAVLARWTRERSYVSSSSDDLLKALALQLRVTAERMRAPRSTGSERVHDVETILQAASALGCADVTAPYATWLATGRLHADSCATVGEAAQAADEAVRRVESNLEARG